MPDLNVTQTDTTNGATGADAPAAGAAADGGQQAPAQRPTTAALPPEVLKERLDHERQRGARQAQEQLFAKYGVSSESELEQKLRRFSALEESEKKRAAEEEEKKRAGMSNEEKLRAENEQLRAQLAQAQSQLQEAQGRVASMRQGQVVRAQAADLIDPDMLDAAELKLAAHIKNLREAGDTAKIAEFEKPAKIREYFRDLAARQPKFAKSAGAPPPKPAPAKKPITTGAAPAKVVPPAKITTSAAPSKTLKPGQKNSMSDAEVKDHLAKTFGPGVKIPGLA